MGWSNSTFQLLIITSSPAGFSGLFVYSPAPGHGNLFVSAAASNGTDPYGNGYTKGVWSYGSATAAAGAAVGMNGSLLFFNDTAGNTGNIGTQITGGKSYLNLQSPPGASGLGVYISPTGLAVATHPGSPPSPVPETWQSMSPLAAGFTGGTPAPRYRLEPTGSGGVVRLAGQISLTANHAAGNTFFTLPAAYVPSIVGQQNLPPTSNNLSGFSFNNGYVIVSPGTGTLDMGSAGSTGNVFWLDDLTYSLD